MWQVIWFFLGVSRLRVTGASPEWVLRRLAEKRITFRFEEKPDDFTADIVVLRRDEARAAACIRAGGCDCAVTAHGGFGTVFGGLRRRPALLALLLAAVTAAVVVPKFVFFYEVEGNETVPCAQILRELDALGVGFGTYGPSIRPQELKNQMLLRIGKLQWLTVQQSGMCARVVVRERPEKEPVLDRKTPQNVVASRAGVLTRVIAESGSCLCAPGQAVTAGELLVSAYTDLGYHVRAAAARAEIYAQTIRSAVCVLPDTAQCKVRAEKSRYAAGLLVGRRRVTLFGGADTEEFCEKETKRYRLTLSGGFSLPLGIEITRICEYDTREEKLREDDVRAQLLAYCEADAQRDMIAGTILHVTPALTHEDGVFRLDCRMQCEEMIARVQPASLKEAIE